MMEIFELDKNPLELFIRVTCMYWFIVLTMRFILKRALGEVGAADVLLLVLVADAASNGMTDQYESITSGIIVVGTLFFWNFIVDRLSLKFKFFDWLNEPPEVLLVKNGKFIQRNLRREHLKEDDLLSEIRKNGLTGVDEVKEMRVERDGKYSVIPK
jgi:uncharacterized membrane protein YcaP (DUF421 family)